MTTGPRFVTDRLVDHHCHGLVQRDLDRSGFESLLNEGALGSSGISLFDSMLGIAIRRWCGPVLGLDAQAPPDAYVERRAELGSADVNARFVSGADVSDFVVDTGFLPEPLCEPTELAQLGGGAAHEVVRLETTAEALLAEDAAPDAFAARLIDRLRTSGAVGAKSIAAYRVGLALPAAKPTDDDLVTALGDVAPDASGRVRLAHPVVNAYLAWTAVEQGMPLQFHVGYGDNDVDLLDCDPLRLTPFLRATREYEVPVLLLHNYPFHRNAAYLAQVFDHVYMDVGLAVHNTGAFSDAVIRESMELVPFGKMLYSSDAFGLAELYYLGSLLFRRGLSSALERLVNEGDLGAPEAERVGAMIGAENARRVYGLRESA
jgi:predicted TIM-barrel fold metal-dependent hydrolase